MNIENISGYTLNDLNKINVLLGKNGCGKSTMLRLVEQQLATKKEAFGKTKYITPERGGILVYEAGTEQSLTNSVEWLPNERRKNQTLNFKQQTVAQYRKLETLYLREIDQDRTKPSFSVYIDKINSLLDNIELRAEDTTFKIYSKSAGTELRAEHISSGESELVSLSIECLIFNTECSTQKENILFLDEPDVHLHPDLQVRLMHFLRDLVSENNFRVLIATHSTAILGALESYTDTAIGFMSSGEKELTFKPITEIYNQTLPLNETNQ